jgi:hypothetical protein
MAISNSSLGADGEGDSKVVLRRTRDLYQLSLHQKGLGERRNDDNNKLIQHEKGTDKKSILKWGGHPV